MLATLLTAVAGSPGRDARALPRWVVPVIFGFAVLVRLAVSTHPHSGEGTPPMFGDYEAQRHWMEITVHTPLREWYVPTARNDLKYWGLDYPPLTAYQSWLYGTFVHAVEPDAVALGTSRGYETYSSKLLMRYTAIFSDVVFLVPGLYVFFRAFNRGVTREREAQGSKGRVSTARAIDMRAAVAEETAVAWSFALAVLAPAQILIDHGHFQYNGVSLGLTAYACAAVISDWDVVGSIAFTLALNHKQMTLYFAPAFFAFLLGKAARDGKGSFAKSVVQVLKLGAAVLGTFVAVWGPFYFQSEPGSANAVSGFSGVRAVFERLVPFERGLYEDYVSNFWCATNPIFKWKSRLSVPTAARASLVATAVSITPSVTQQIRRPSTEGFVWCLFNCSLGFFLFSFQAHEKSALLPSLPASMLAWRAPELARWIPLVVCFSVWPLLKRDRLQIAYVALVVGFAALADGDPPLGGSAEKAAKKTKPLAPVAEQRLKRGGFLRGGFRGFATPRAARRIRFATRAFVCAGTGTLHLLELVFEPPARWPYLHDLAVTTFCFCLFSLAFAYGNWRQARVPAGAVRDGDGRSDGGARGEARETKTTGDSDCVSEESRFAREAAGPNGTAGRRRRTRSGRER